MSHTLHTVSYTHLLMSLQEGQKSINQKLNAMNKKMDETIEESRKFGEKLRREREQREQSNPKRDDQMEVEEVTEGKNMEPTNPEPEDSGGKKIQISQEKEEVKMEERRTLRPRKARVTKELIEMTRNGLINVVNLPIINHEERVFRKEYRRSIMEMDEKENYVTTKKKMTNRISQPRVSKRRVKYFKKMCIRDRYRHV